MSSKRIAVLAAGSGANLQALIDRFAYRGTDAGQLVWVGSNRADAGALVRAQNAGIATGVIGAHADGAAMLSMLNSCGAELLVLTGYLKLVPAAVVQAFRGRMLNIHPALLPSFGGAGMYGSRVHEAVIASGATVSGATVHFVDDQYDLGAIVAQWPVPVLAGDSAVSLAARVLQAEHRLLPLCVELVSTGAITLGENGRRVVRGGAALLVDAFADMRFSLTTISPTAHVASSVSDSGGVSDSIDRELTALLFP